jgi:hypothetical protein
MFTVCYLLLCHFPVLWLLLGPIGILLAVAQFSVWRQLLFPPRSERIRRDAVRAAGFAARGQVDQPWDRVA